MMNPYFDPSKMDPKLMMELSNLVRQLPPEKIMKMQSLMHNMMAGLDVSKEMEEFEKGLPPGFREKVISLMGPGMMGGMGGMTPPPAASSATTIETQGTSTTAEMNMREARLTILRAVADGRMSPEEAEEMLFGSNT